MSKCGDVYYADFKAINSSNHSKTETTNFKDRFQYCKANCPVIEANGQEDSKDLDELLRKYILRDKKIVRNKDSEVIVKFLLVIPVLAVAFALLVLIESWY